MYFVLCLYTFYGQLKTISEGDSQLSTNAHFLTNVHCGSFHTSKNIAPIIIKFVTFCPQAIRTTSQPYVILAKKTTFSYMPIMNQENLKFEAIRCKIVILIHHRTFESTQSIVLLNEVFHQKRGQHLPLERRLSNFGPGVPVLEERNSPMG